LIALAPAHFLYDKKDPLSQWHILPRTICWT
jgi:hypothetical protein